MLKIVTAVLLTAWALVYYTFDKLPVMKMLISTEYAFVRSQVNVKAGP